MKAPEVDATTFDKLLRSGNQPVLVDFHAEWCGPCKMMGPIIDEVAESREGSAIVAKLNIDRAPEIARRYNITGIPTLIVFKNGQPVETARGVQSKAALVALLDRSA